MLKALLAVLLTGLFSCSSTDHISEIDLPGHAPLDDFDKALGIYAQGLLVFEDNAEEGIKLLQQAVILAPNEQRIVDDYVLNLNKKVNQDSTLESDVSDHEILHGTLVKTFSQSLKNNPLASYSRLKLIESFLALDQYPNALKALTGAANQLEDRSLYLAKVRYLRAVAHPGLSKELQRILVESHLVKDSDLHLTAIRYLIENGPYENAEQIMSHVKATVKTIPEMPADLPRVTVMTLLDGVLFGSDIGNAARNQAIDGIDYTNSTAQWSLLAGIFMKLEMYEEAYLVIKHRVLRETDLRWRASLNLAICCQKLGRDKERIKYLEQTLLGRPHSSYTKKSLLVAHTVSGDPQRALEIYDDIHDENDFWLQKIHFYILKETGKYESAFKVAEKIFNWPDTGKKITGITASMASTIVPVYLKMGKPALMEKRIKQAMGYLPDDMSLLNSLAYHYALESYKLDQAEEWMKKVYSHDQVTSAYADTLAWVYYKQGKYKEARKEIDFALKSEKESSAEILMHAGDIYLKLGMKQQAVAFWEKALKKDSKLKEELRLRLQK